MARREKSWSPSKRGLRWKKKSEKAKKRGDYFLNAIDFFLSTRQRTCRPCEAGENLNPFLILAFFFLITTLIQRKTVKILSVHLSSLGISFFFFPLKKLISFQWVEKEAEGGESELFSLKRKFVSKEKLINDVRKDEPEMKASDASLTNHPFKRLVLNCPSPACCFFR